VASFSASARAGGERWAHVQLDDEGAALLVSAVYGGQAQPDSPSPLRPLVAQCLHDLLASILKEAETAPAPTDADWMRMMQYGSGAVLLEVQVGAALLPVVLSPALVQRFLPSPQVDTGSRPLARRDAVLGQKVVLDVELGEAAVELAALAELQPGDVIVFDRHADAPLTVRARGGSILCEGYLGLAEGAPAIQLYKLTNP
jgi:flagellar motor switch/type III secretory pathway protein FliN